MSPERKPYKRQSASDAGARGRRPGARPGAPRRPVEHEGDRARECVMRALATQARRYPDMDLAALDASGLEERDAAFAHALYDAVVRRWLTLWALLEWRLERPREEVEPRAAAALLAGAAQMFLLDRVPAHAAVNTSVEWVKRRGTPGGSRMVNAVLRGVSGLIHEGGKERREAWSDGRDEIPLSGGGALGLTAPVLPADPLQRLSAATSVPIELLRHWSKHRSTREARRLALHRLVSPPVILNTAFASSALPEGCVPHTAPGHHVYTGTHGALSELLRGRRDIWAQDPASSLAVGSVTDLRPGVVIDACAGMGTKTRQLAAVFPGARIVASDVDLPRVRALREAVKGLEVEVVPYERLIDWSGKADLVLLDVPCSNTGVLARRVEAAYRFTRENQEKVCAVQRQIIADSVRLLKPGGGGRLLYSTCSLDPAENREQAAWACRWHGFRIGREHDRLPEGLPGDPAEKYSDGSYAVLLE